MARVVASKEIRREASFWVQTLLLLFLGLFSIQLVFFLLANGEAGHKTHMIRAFTNDTRVLTNPYLFTQRMEDLESTHSIKCAVLQNKLDLIPFVDLRFRSVCSQIRILNQYLMIKEWKVSSELPGSNGSVWNLQFISINSAFFQLALWFSRLGFVSFLILFRWYQRKIFKIEVRRHLAENRALMAFADVSSQVAHDIRSPLAAIQAIDDDLKYLPEESRVRLRNATMRIQDIANSLIEKNREILNNSFEPSYMDVDSEGESVQLLSSLVESLITEKRMQYRSRIGVEIESKFCASAYGLFARVQPVEFKRIISNLVNNGVEALKDRGNVTVTLVGSSSNIEIRIRDSGIGIAPDLIKKLGHRGETHGKQGGSGLGLYYAREKFEVWGGQLQIQSKIGEGTEVVLSLLREQPPAWFVSELRVFSNQIIVVLDDDSSIHGIWQSRFDSLNLESIGLSIFHFTTPNELRVWASSRKQFTSVLFLCDFELLGFQESGLDLVVELGVESQSILVTSRFEERSLRDRCSKLKVPIVPKGMAAFVPIQVVDADDVMSQNLPTSLECLDAILIDDSEINRDCWEFGAKKEKVRILTFDNTAAFLDVFSSLDKKTPIFIDQNLRNGRKGTEEAKIIYDLGFKLIYISSGYESRSFSSLYWIRGFIGKKFPREIIQSHKYELEKNSDS